MLGWRLEATDMLNGNIVAVVAQILVEYSKNLVIQNLELAYTISHFLQWLEVGKKHRMKNYKPSGCQYITFAIACT